MRAPSPPCVCSPSRLRAGRRRGGQRVTRCQAERGGQAGVKVSGSARMGEAGRPGMSRARAVWAGCEGDQLARAVRHPRCMQQGSACPSRGHVRSITCCTHHPAGCRRMRWSSRPCSWGSPCMESQKTAAHSVQLLFLHSCTEARAGPCCPAAEARNTHRPMSGTHQNLKSMERSCFSAFCCHIMLLRSKLA